jgi:hypothetical protein
MGRKIRISGTLITSMNFLLEAVPPWNCLLRSYDNTGEVGVRIIDKNAFGLYDYKNVTITGIFTAGETGPLIIRTVYYVETQSAVLIA